MSLLDGDHYHVFKFEDSDPRMPYGTYVGTDAGAEFALAEYEKMKAKHPGTWFATCGGDCLTAWREKMGEGVFSVTNDDELSGSEVECVA